MNYGYEKLDTQTDSKIQADRKFRKANNLIQKALGDLVGVSKTTLYQ